MSESVDDILDGRVMAHGRSTQRHQRARTTQTCRRAVGTGSAVAAFLAFGLGPLAQLHRAAPARADEFGIDSIIDALAGVDPLAGAGEAAGAAAGSDALNLSSLTSLFGQGYLAGVQGHRYRPPPPHPDIRWRSPRALGSLSEIAVH